MMRHLLLAALLVLIGCGSDETGAPRAKPPSFEQTGYFKSTARARLFTFSVSGTAEPDQVHAHAKRQMHTKGAPTASYYWPEGARIPGMEIARQPEFFAATDLVHSSSYDAYTFLGVISPNGELSIYDCRPPEPDAMCSYD